MITRKDYRRHLAEFGRIRERKRITNENTEAVNIKSAFSQPLDSRYASKPVKGTVDNTER
jgi:hypothetical protein